ncbi:MAG: cell envelope integrity protein TolA [Vicinamibacterales bacterium]
MIRFDLDDRYQDEPLVGTAIPRREAVVISIVVHGLIALALILAPTVPAFQRSPEELQALIERQQRMRPPEENRTFVFVQPRVDLEAARPPERAELSDKDRMATAPERAVNPTNPLPFARGNSRERVEASEMERARGPESPAPPSPGEVAPPRPTGEVTQPLPPSDNGLTLPRETPEQARAGSGALGEALRNLQRYVQRESFDNQRGDGGQFGPFIQFDTKGVEFGPWVRRFVAQVKRNWFIPYAAMTMRGHVVLQFNVHKDGRITDLAVVGPSSVDAFNNAAANAILTSDPTEPLPPEYPADKAFFTVTFYYNEEPPGR